MEKHLIKRLIYMALATAPVMALMLITPVFILTDVEGHNFFLMWGFVSLVVIVAWTFNISALVVIKKTWVKTWVRLAAITSIMFAISFIVFYFISPYIKIDSTKITMVRFVNILAVNTIIYILIDLVITRENKDQIALENANLKLVNLEAEYKLLKEQINPHFLFNALGTAKALIRKQPQQAEEYIIRLSDFLRAGINNQRKTTSLKEELILCREFIALNKIRFADALIFTEEINVDTERFFVPYFSLLSLAENAIKHNLLTNQSPLQIVIIATNDSVIVKNNLQPKFVLENDSKTGLKNLEERYRLLGTPGIHIESGAREFIVTIPLLKK